MKKHEQTGLIAQCREHYQSMFALIDAVNRHAAALAKAREEAASEMDSDDVLAILNHAEPGERTRQLETQLAVLERARAVGYRRLSDMAETAVKLASEVGSLIEAERHSVRARARQCIERAMDLKLLRKIHAAAEIERFICRAPCVIQATALTGRETPVAQPVVWMGPHRGNEYFGNSTDAAAALRSCCDLLADLERFDPADAATWSSRKRFPVVAAGSEYGPLEHGRALANSPSYQPIAWRGAICQ
jgi:hypothetical protein